MIDTLTSTPFFGLGLTLLCWFLAVKLQKKTNLLICNPVLVSSLLVIAVMVIFHIPMENYTTGADVIKMLLAPATANAEIEGFGLKSVAKAIEKYDGDYEWDYDADQQVFTFTVMVSS